MEAAKLSNVENVVKTFLEISGEKQTQASEVQKTMKMLYPRWTLELEEHLEEGLTNQFGILMLMMKAHVLLGEAPFELRELVIDAAKESDVPDYAKAASIIALTISA